MVDALLNDVKSLGYDVTLSEAARATLRGFCLADLSNGGRGIRNQVEAHLINPLSRALFDGGAETGRRYRDRGNPHRGIDGAYGCRVGDPHDRKHCAVAHPFSGDDLGARSKSRHLVSGLLDPLSWLHLDGHVGSWPRKRRPSTKSYSAIAQWIPATDGITVSGGEPFDQPEALFELLARCGR